MNLHRGAVTASLRYIVLGSIVLLTAVLPMSHSDVYAQEQQQEEQVNEKDRPTPSEIRDDSARWDFALIPGYSQGVLEIQGSTSFALRGFSNTFMLRWRRLPLYLMTDVGYLFGGSTVANALGFKRTHVLFADPKFGVYRLVNLNNRWRIVPRIGGGVTVFRPFLGIPSTQGRPGFSTYGDVSLGGGISLESREPIWNGGKLKVNLKYNKIFVSGTTVALGIPGTDSFGRHLTFGAGFFWSIGEDPAEAKKERDDARRELAETRTELTTLAESAADPKVSAELNSILQKVVTLETLLEENPEDATIYSQEIDAYRRRATEIHVAYINDMNRRREELARRTADSLTVEIARAPVNTPEGLVSSYMNAINSRAGVIDNKIYKPEIASQIQKHLDILNRFEKVRAYVYKQRPDGYDIALSHAIDDTLNTRDIQYPWIQRVTIKDGKIDYVNYVPDSTSYQYNVIDPFPSDPRSVDLRDEVLFIMEPLRVSLEQSIADPLVDYLDSGVRVDMYALRAGMNRLEDTVGKSQFISFMRDYLARGNNLISIITIRAVNDTDVEVDMLFRQFDKGVLLKILNRSLEQTNLLNEGEVVRKVIATFRLKKSGSAWTVTNARWRARIVGLDDEALWPRIINSLGRR